MNGILKATFIAALTTIVLTSFQNCSESAIQDDSTNQSASDDSPIIISQPSAPANIAVGASLVLFVQAEGTGLSYIWIKNDQELSNQTGSTLVIANTTAADSGTYVVRVSNATSSVTSDPVTVAVGTPGPDGAVLYAQHCASCHGDLATSEKKDRTSAQISAAIGSVADMMIPTLAALTTVEKDSIAWALDTTRPTPTPPGATPTPGPTITITRQPTPQIGLMGQAANFVVEATGAATLYYQWLKDGTPIAGATSASYSIARVTGAEATAKFSVRISSTADGSGGVTSSEASLVMQTQTFPITTACGPTGNRKCKMDGAPLRRLNSDAVCRARTNNAYSIASSWRSVAKDNDDNFAWVESVAGTAPNITVNWFLDGDCNSCQLMMSEVTCFK